MPVAEETHMPRSAVDARGSKRRSTGTRLTRGGDPDAAQMRRLLRAGTAVGAGNFRKRLPVSGEGLGGELAGTFNESADRQLRLLAELSRVRRGAGGEGRHSERLEPGPGEGGW